MLEPQYRHLRTATEKGALVLAITTPLVMDEKVADELRHDILAALDFKPTPKVVLDFSCVKYISSAAFRPVITLQRRVQELKGRLVLCALSTMAAEVFSISGLIGDSTGGAPFEAELDLRTALARLAA